jgi:D-amino peptidase
MQRFRGGLVALVTVICAVVHTDASAQRPVKIYISTDMEGVAGIVSMEQTGPSPDYDWARHLMTAEVNAAVGAAFDAGATEVLVNDAHGSHTNMRADELDPRATLITGTPTPRGMMEGIDSTFAAVLFVGFHARAGTTAAIIDHTYTLSIEDVKLNGQEVGEYGLNAALAGYYGVPVIFMSGDRAAAEQVRAFIPGIETVAVKDAIARYAARTMNPQAARTAIAAGVRTAMARRGQIQPVRLAAPITFEVELTNSGFADNVAMIPGARRTGPRTVTYVAPDMVVAYRVSRLVPLLAR